MKIPEGLFLRDLVWKWIGKGRKGGSVAGPAAGAEGSVQSPELPGEAANKAYHEQDQSRLS